MSGYIFSLAHMGGTGTTLPLTYKPIDHELIVA